MRSDRLETSDGGARGLYIDQLESRVHLSATLEYRPQKPDGTLDAPVTVITNDPVQDFKPEQSSLLQQGTTSADFDLFLQLTNIPGESKDVDHANQIELLSFSWGHDASYAFTDTGFRAGKSQFQELHVTARVSKASPRLLDAMAKGTHIADAVLYVRKPGAEKGGGEFMQVKLQDVIVSSYQVQPGSPSGGFLVEEVTLAFGRGGMEYRRQRQDGTFEGATRFEAAAIPVEDYAPPQRSLIQSGSVEAPGQYLSVAGILGESKNAAHPDWIDVRSFRWGGDLQYTFGTSETGGMRAGKAEFHELHVSATVSKASPKLMQSMATGKHIATAVLAVTNPGLSGDFYKLALTDVVVSSYQLVTNADGALVEEFTLSFADVNLEYRARKADGTLDVAVPFQALQTGARDFAPPQASVLGAGVGGNLDAFLDIPGIPGESRDDVHADEIAVAAFAWGGDLIYSPLGAGKVGFHELRLSTRLSKASPLLMDRLMKGTHLPIATLVLRKPTRSKPVDFFTVTLQDVVVSSYKVTTAADGSPVEEISLAFGDVEVGYRAQKPDGTMDAEVVFRHSAGAVTDYVATQRSLLLDGFAMSGNTDTFLRLDGILGESNDTVHRDLIDVRAFEWGADAVHAAVGTGLSVGKSKLHELHVVSRISRASPKLMRSMAFGDTIATGDLFVRATGDKPVEYLRVNLKNVVVSSYQMKPGVDGELLEEYTLAFTDVRADYFPRNLDGSLQKTPVTFQATGQVVEDFAPPDVALIDRGLEIPQATDVVLSLPGIAGESRVDQHAGQIDVLSFSWGGDVRLDPFAGRGVSEMRELHVVARVSKASPKIIDAISDGTRLAEAELFFVKPGFRGVPDEFMQVRLDDVLVSSYKTTTANDGSPLEEFTLTFRGAEWEYRRMKPDGTLDNAVSFAERGLGVTDFAPTQKSILRGADLSSLDGFIDIDDVPGESNDFVHRDEVDVLGFSWGGDVAMGGQIETGIVAGRPAFQELHLVARTSRAAPRLLDQLTRGRIIPGAMLVLRKAGSAQDFFTIKLANVIVSSYRVTTEKDGELLEEFTLAYGPGGTPPEPPSTVTLAGTAGADTFFLRRSGSNINVFANDAGSGTPAQVIPGGTGITVEALAGDDVIVIDQGGGDVVVPGQLVVRGGDGKDTLRFLNATGNATINQLGVTTVGGTSVDHGVIESHELSGILIGLLLPANQTLKLAGGEGQTTVQDLNIGTGARLDLDTNDLKVPNGDLATVEALLKSARDGVTRWQGPGIGTSAATAVAALAPVQQGADVLVKYTYNGDVNGDGLINSDDYFRIDSGFLSQPASPLYNQGDFNFDDTINSDDYFLIDSAFLGQGTLLAAAVEGGSGPSVTWSVAAQEPDIIRAKRVRRPVAGVFSDRPVGSRAR